MPLLGRIGCLLLLVMSFGTPHRLARAAAAPARVAAARAEPVFPLRASKNGRYLTDAKGAPFFFHADTAWGAPMRLTREEMVEYLDRRKSDGFTGIMAHTFSRTGDGRTGQSKDGHEPFSPAQDITHPNEAYWKNVDAFLEAAAARGLAVALAPLWVEWGGVNREGWRYTIDDKNASTYGRFLGRRYRRFKNLMWILGGDANPIEITSAIDRLGHTLAREAPHQLIMVHNRPNHASAAFFDRASWLGVNLAYTYEEVWRHVWGEWCRLGKPRPILLGESGYEHENNDKRGGLPSRIRRQAYEGVLAGALAGHAYGHRDVYFFRGDWRKGLGDVGGRQMAHVKTLFGGIAHWKIAPDVHHRLFPGTREQVNGEGHVTAAMAEDRTFAVAYFPVRQTVSLVLDTLAGTVQGTWFDPTSGARQPAFGSRAAAGEVSVTPPEKNGAGDADWVLIVQTPAAS